MLALSCKMLNYNGAKKGVGWALDVPVTTVVKRLQWSDAKGTGVWEPAGGLGAVASAGQRRQAGRTHIRWRAVQAGSL